MMSNKAKFLVLGAITLGVVLVLFVLISQEPPAEPVANEEEAEEPVPEERQAGEVGEEEEEVITPTLPQIISSTVGEILEIHSDHLVILGSGTNFVDGQERELTCNFDETSLVFTSDRLTHYQGFSGLDYLSLGMEVLVSGQENIRGKTEFKVKTVTMLN